MATQQLRAFTAKGAGRLPVLKTQCKVAIAHSRPGEVAADGFKDFTAIWDTGATGTCITQSVVDAVGLKPTGVVQVHGVNGIHLSETYLVNVVLPNGVQFGGVKVTKGILPGGANGDLLIGMDIITMGDFSLTNKGGVTWFSFQVPAQNHVDYVQEIEDEHKARLTGVPLPPIPSRQQRRADARKHNKKKR